MQNPRSISRLAAVAGLLAASSQAASAADLDVTIHGVTPRQGVVLVGLYTANTPFGDKPLAYASAQVTGDSVTVKFPAVAAGEYAISAFQDTNGNHKLDRGKYGIPTEKYGFSRDARGNYGPPEFHDASFVVGAKPQLISFTLE